MKKNKYIILILFSIFIILFTKNNYFLYNSAILEVTNVENTAIKDSEKIKQNVKGIIKNGTQKGKVYTFSYESSKSLVKDIRINKGIELFVDITSSKDISVIEVKRDVQIVMLIALVIDLIVIIAGKQGIKSIISTIINIILMISIILFHTKTNHKYNLLLIFIPITSILIVLTLFISNGNNKKTKTAIYASITSVIISFILSFLLLKIYESNIYFYTMDFIEVAYDYQNIYYVIVLLSSLGAIMDISITMSSSFYEIIDKNPEISFDKLKKSGLRISSDIIGTMINVLMLTTIITILPTVIFLFKNNMNIINAIYVYGQTQIILILTSSIGIILSIPISMYTSLYIYKGRIK